MFIAAESLAIEEHTVTVLRHHRSAGLKRERGLRELCKSDCGEDVAACANNKISQERHSQDWPKAHLEFEHFTRTTPST